MKNSLGQFEMFSDDYAENHSVKGSFKNSESSYISKIRQYQKIIFLIFGFIFVAIISFSFGVEKGKRQIIAKLDLKTHQGAIKGASLAKPLVEHVDTIAEKGSSALLEQEKGKENKIDKESYTVQVASILKSRNVDKALESLRSSGHSAFSLTKGKYKVICIGTFSVKKDAQSYQRKLKAKYPDCQIRRL